MGTVPCSWHHHDLPEVSTAAAPVLVLKGLWGMGSLSLSPQVASRVGDLGGLVSRLRLPFLHSQKYHRLGQEELWQGD